MYTIGGLRQIVEVYTVVDSDVQHSSGFADLSAFYYLQDTLMGVPVNDPDDPDGIRNKCNSVLENFGNSNYRLGEVKPGSKFNPSTGDWEPDEGYYAFKIHYYSGDPDNPLGGEVPANAVFQVDAEWKQADAYIYVAVLV